MNKNKSLLQQLFGIERLSVSLILFLFFSSIIPDNRGPFSITKTVVIDSVKYNKYPSKRGYNSEFVFYSKSGQYYIINDIIHYTNSRSFAEMHFPSTVKITYRRRWFWLIGVKFIFQIQYNSEQLVDLNQYRKDMNFYLYLIYVLLIYICISSIVNAILWIRNRYHQIQKNAHCISN